jgi:hypothetical protein
MNRKLISIFIVALTVSLTFSKSITSDITHDVAHDIEIGFQDEESLVGPREDSEVAWEENIGKLKGKFSKYAEKAQPTVHELSEKFSEYAEKAQPTIHKLSEKFSKYAEKAQPTVDAYSGWLYGKWNRAKDAAAKKVKIAMDKYKEKSLQGKTLVGPREDSEVAWEEQINNIKGKFSEYAEKAQPTVHELSEKFSEYAEKAQPTVDAYSGWLFGKWNQAVKNVKLAMDVQDEESLVGPRMDSEVASEAASDWMALMW